MSLPMINFRNEDVKKHKQICIDFGKLLRKYKDVNSKEHQYIKKIKSSKKKILIGSLNELKTLKEELDIIHCLKTYKCLKPVNRKKCANCQSCKKNIEIEEFVADIQGIIKYEPSKVIKYFHGLNNRACYICNAQYTIFAYQDYKIHSKDSLLAGKKLLNRSKKYLTIQKSTKAKFQLDHYFPKSLYPAFSLALYNLIPICSNCNLIKNNSVFDFEQMHSKIEFRLEEESLFEYYKDKSQQALLSLEITKDTTTDNLSKIFDLKGIYDNHIDVIEEVIARKIKYTKNYKQALERKFGSIVRSENVIDERLILGAYPKSEGFHIRPLSKLIHDINDQLDGYHIST